MLWDTHLHTRYSGDSTAEPEDMVQAALQHGLDGICFTDHIDYDYPKEPELFLFDMDAIKTFCQSALVWNSVYSHRPRNITVSFYRTAF